MPSAPTPRALPPAAVAELRAQLTGEVVVPTEDTYDDARATWNLIVDHYPALVVLPETAEDIAVAVRFAVAHGLDVALQATGHGVIRNADDALLINTAHMTAVTIDPAAQTAWIAAGAKWGDVLNAAQDHGLAPLLGSSPEVGAVAYTLGGGSGWLVRKYGLASDSALRFQVVTADGQIRTASADENPDLFWGLRGGGGSLAAVAGMEVQLYPVDTVYGGFMVYPTALAGDVLTRWREWIKTVPDELTTAVKIINLPDMEDVPPLLRGQTAVFLAGCYVGPAETGAALLQPWRDWQEPMLDAFHPMSFRDVGDISQDPTDPMPSFLTGVWLKELDDATIDALVRYATLQEARVPLIFAEVRHIGGAVGTADASQSAFGYRDSELLLELVGLVPAPQLWQALTDYADRLRAEIAPALTGTVYMNFLEGEEAQARVRDGFPPETFARLVELKGKYDPNNLFNRTMAIPVE
jgi:FAD/FMN-containing dehydrogenase